MHETVPRRQCGAGKVVRSRCKMPDIVILNGKLITMDGHRAEALAISNGYIQAVGTTSEIREISSGARIIDAGGATVLPGFIDSHVHLFNGSVELDYLNLSAVSGLDDLTSAVREYGLERPNDTVLFAASMDYRVADGRHPTRHDLDRVMPHRPFAAIAADHHTVWANTRALQAANLLHGAKVPDGSEVVIGEDGMAHGELRETGAFQHILALTALGGRDLLGYVTGNNPDPPATPSERALDKTVIAKGLRHCASHGITGLHLMDGNFYQGELLSEMCEEGTLSCRCEVPMHLKNHDPIERLGEAFEMRRRLNSTMLWSKRIKMFMDGVVDSRTAYMLEPYPGTDNRSKPLFSPEHFAKICTLADSRGLQISVHAIGDAAVRATLDGYEAARRINGPRDSRHRIEHIEIIHPDDLKRLVPLGVVASVQPLHSPAGGLFPPYDPDNLIRAEQIPLTFATRDIRNTGAKVIFSTDWPVVPVDVMPSVKAAVYRNPLPDEWPDQSSTLLEALESYTSLNAWVEFNEDKKGKLCVGMLADVVVMDHDIMAMEPSTLDQARAAITICGGRITWEA